MTKLVYCATPSRLEPYTDRIIELVGAIGLAPLHPFKAMPRKYFENGKPGRRLSMDYCLRLVSISDEVHVFGISDGVLQETSHALRLGKPVVLNLENWAPGDEEWRKFYAELGPKYDNHLDVLLRKREHIV